MSAPAAAYGNPGVMPEGFRQIGKHVEGCHAAADADGLTFIVYEGRRYDLNKNGVGRGSTLWHTYRCNDTRCEARMLVRWDVLSRFVSLSAPIDYSKLPR